jgi:hypothetical protein
MRGWGGSRRLISAAASLLALLAPSGAAAATVVNGDFESGTLQGWHVRQPIFAGNWFAYKGTKAPIGSQRGADPVQPPPQGAYAAISDEANPDSLILYQDIALEAGQSHLLSMLVYYDSYEPIAVPTPDTLSVDEEVLAGQRNQQYRIDVMRSGAPIASLDPADILRTLFRTAPGDPQRMQPTKLTADLSPFAGRTVRLRIANAVHEEVFNAGVDAVSITSTKPGQSPPRGSKPHAPNRLGFGRAKANRRNGTVRLPVRVPGPGLLTARGKPRKAIEPVTVRVRRAGTVTIRLKPTPATRAVLKQKHRLRVKVAVTFKPTGDPTEAASLPVVFRLSN